jgi:hypothetical protein
MNNLTKSQNHLQFAKRLSADAKTALGKGDLKTANAMIAGIDRETKTIQGLLQALDEEIFQLSVESATKTFYLCQRLRGVLSLGEATGKLSREDTKILHELRRLPATLDGALDSTEGVKVFEQLRDVTKRIALHVPSSVEKHQLEKIHSQF